MKYKSFISKNFFLDLFISFLFKICQFIYIVILIDINYYNINLFLKNIFFFSKLPMFHKY
jgi:hypothetical protein